MKKLLIALLFVVGCGTESESLTEVESSVISTDACGVTVTSTTINYNCTKHPHWLCDTYDFTRQKCTRTKPKDPLPGALSCGARPAQNYDTIVWHGWNGVKSNAACMIIPQFTFYTQAGQNPDLLMEYGWAYSAKSIKVVGFMDVDSELVIMQLNGSGVSLYSNTLFTGDQKTWSSPLPTIWLTVPTWNSFNQPVNPPKKVISSFYTF